MDFLDSKIILVTGKGGVGKSAIAAMLALESARRGKKTLLVELGEYSFYESFFDINSVKHDPISLEPRLEIARWGREECLKDYVLHYLKVERLYNLFFQNKVMEAFFNAAPTVAEISIAGKLTSGVRDVGPSMDYDVIIADAYATGHFLALLRGPKGLHEAVPVGPIREQTEGILKVLRNPQLTSYVVVTLAETLPTVEALELYKSIESEMGVQPKMVCNRLWRPPVSVEEMEYLETHLEAESPARPFHNYLQFILSRQRKQLDQLMQTGPVWCIPLIYDSTDTRTLLTHMREGSWMSS